MGIRDYGLVESAVFQPRQSFGGTLLYESTHLMAAVYLEGLVRNHGFVDGNKRTAARSVFVFCRLNGRLFLPPEDEWVAIVVQVATGSISRSELVRYIESNCTVL